MLDKTNKIQTHIHILAIGIHGNFINEKEFHILITTNLKFFFSKILLKWTCICKILSYTEYTHIVIH